MDMRDEIVNRALACRALLRRLQVECDMQESEYNQLNGLVDVLDQYHGQPRTQSSQVVTISQARRNR